MEPSSRIPENPRHVVSKLFVPRYEVRGLPPLLDVDLLWRCTGRRAAPMLVAGLLAAATAGCQHSGGAGPTAVDRAVDRSSGGGKFWEGTPPYPGPCQEIGDTDGDDDPEWLLERVYTDAGRVVREVYDHGGDGEPNTIQTYEYRGGNLRRKTKDTGADGTADAIETFEYDNEGRRIRRTVDMNGDDQPEKQFRFRYDSSGRLVRKGIDYGADGTEDGIWTYEYDGDRKVSESWDKDADGTVDETLRFEYVEGAVAREVLEMKDAEEPEQVVRYERNDEGDAVVERRDLDGDGGYEEVVRIEYDDRGRRTRVALDENGDGTPDETTQLEYDSDGNLIEKSWDRDGDEKMDRNVQFQYGCWPEG